MHGTTAIEKLASAEIYLESVRINSKVFSWSRGSCKAFLLQVKFIYLDPLDSPNVISNKLKAAV
jgi:hypothetical protein